MGLNLAEERRLQRLERQNAALNEQLNEHAARLLTIENLLATLAQDEEDEEKPETDLEGNLVPKPEADPDAYAGLG